MHPLLGTPGRVLFLLHHNADHDAVCSAAALKRGLSRVNPGAEVRIGAAKGVSRDGRKVAGAMGEEIAVDPELDADLVVLLDTSTLGQLEQLGERLGSCGAKIAVIDHHARHRETEEIADYYIVDERASSTAEIVHGLLIEAGVEPDAEIASALLLGILADTGHLRLARPETVHVVSELLKTPDVDYDLLESLLEVEEDPSRKLAHLKAGQRAEIERVGEWIIATSVVGSFGASAARALVMLGADAAFVGTSSSTGLQVSSRASKRFLEGTGIHLGKDIMPSVGESIGGSGGGHAGAAGAAGKGEGLDEALVRCVELVRERITTSGTSSSSP